MIRILQCIVFFVLILCLAGCVPAVKAVKIPSVENKPEIQNMLDSEIEPVSFEKVIVTIKRGTLVGSINPSYQDSTQDSTKDNDPHDFRIRKTAEKTKLPHYMENKGYQYACDTSNSQEMIWGTGALTLSGMDGEFSDYFREALTPYGYEITGERGIIFERNEELNRGTYRVAANIIEMKTNICQLRDVVWTGQLTNKFIGEMWMNIDWIIYSTLERKKIATLNTKGFAEVNKPQSTTTKLLLLNTFAAAAENLAKEPNFLKIVSSGKFPTSDAIDSQDKYSPLHLEITPLSNKPLGLTVEYTLNSVVTVRSTAGHGSGFVIDQNGYILTNAHVAGKSDKVRIKFRSGFELNGIVRRIDELRDVALIQVDASGLIPLPLNTQIPKIAANVFAIGTPLKENLNSTVTNGIVSAIRKDERSKLPIIQSDVAIQQGSSGGPLLDKNGNVLGIAVAGYGPSPYSAGINLFIPILSALDRLNIQMDNNN